MKFVDNDDDDDDDDDDIAYKRCVSPSTVTLAGVLQPVTSKLAERPTCTCRIPLPATPTLLAF